MKKTETEMENDASQAGEVRVLGVSVARADAPLCDDGVRWVRRGDARRRCGVGRDILDLWVADGKVEAHKLNPGRNGTVVFSATDIDRAIRAAPPYMPSENDAAPLRGASGF